MLDADSLIKNVTNAVVTRESTVRLLAVSLLAGGHLLLRDLPGVGKTLLARSLARSILGSFKRIQFTADLLPSDVTGSAVFRQAEGRFDFVPGPVFANILMADEINRASPRTQSALLEAMAEGHVTVDGQKHPLPDPFWVVATQNDLDEYGAFPLPRAQMDRFMMVLGLGYPDLAGQVQILERNQRGDPTVDPVLTTDRLKEMQQEVKAVQVAPLLREYIARLVVSTHSHPGLELGVSPRGAVHLQRASQAWAALDGSPFVLPEHVRHVAPLVLQHRLLPKSSASSQEVIEDILTSTPVPL
ncbi:MAG: MoxR family ATPase [SAR202 cluster bacterium]|nr:MoxR family ATPase [SAR202 cluster bacterium]